MYEGDQLRDRKRFAAVTRPNRSNRARPVLDLPARVTRAARSAPEPETSVVSSTRVGSERFIGLALSAFAQAPRNVAPGHAHLGWDGRPVTHACHADAADLQGLKATLVEHEKTRIGFKNKIRFGVFSGGS